MFKKLLIVSAMLAATSTLAFADAAPYVGAGLGITTTTTKSSSFRGTTGTVLAGYGGTMSALNPSIYLGGEVSANLFTVVLNNNSSNYSLRSTYSYGLSFIPGIKLSRSTMAFARLGVLKTRFSNLSSSGTTGGQIGLGLQTSLTQNLDLRGEYDYVAYNKVSGASPMSDQFNVALIYKFL